MSGTNVKVNSRRMRSTQSPPPGAGGLDPSGKGTVLLRNPLPKYSFETQLKKGKNSANAKANADKIKDTSANVGETSEKLTAYKTDTVSEISKGNIKESLKTAAGHNDSLQIGRLVNSFPQAIVDPELMKHSPSSTQKKEYNEANTESSETVVKEKPVNKVDPFSTSGVTKLSHSVSESSVIHHELVSNTRISDNQSRIASDQQRTCHQTSPSQQEVTSQNQSENGPGTVSQNSELERQANVADTHCCVCQDKIKHLEEEKQMMKNQLEVQLQVNQELKKLLVASVGEDLQHRVERLTRDRALLCMEVGDYNKKQTEDYEHLDKISIQADMWRSKYLACRVMADELASSKAFYTMQFQECQMALQQLLNERHELRANLYDTYRGLQQIQEAFDPLNSQSSVTRLLTSKNILDLARTNQHLTESVKYRLLPSHVTSTINNKMEPDWHDYLTNAEAHAQELLTREVRPEDFRFMSKSSIVVPGVMAVDRFHPCARYDNLTLNVCCKCKGEISIV